MFIPQIEYPIDGTACELDLDAIERENQVVAGMDEVFALVLKISVALVIGVLIGFLLAGVVP